MILAKGSKIDNGLASEKIQEFQKQGDVYSKKLELERRKMEEMDVKIKELQETVYKTKTNMKHSGVGNEVLVSKAKNIRTLENRLEKSLTKYNETCNLNKILRQEIQDLRREKVQQVQIREKLDRDLHVRKEKVKKSIELSQAAYDARDRGFRMIEATKQQEADMIASFEDEWNRKKKELARDQQKLKDMPNIRSAANAKRAADIRSDVANSIKKEINAKQDSHNAHHSQRQKQMELRKLQERVMHFESIFDQIWSQTDATSIDDMVKGFLSAEEQNFSMFNMINQLNTEIEDMEVKNHELVEIGKSFQDAEPHNEKNRAKIKQHLEDQIKASQEMAQSNESRYIENMTIIDSMKSGIMSIFQKVGCSDEGLGQQLTSTGVTDINIMQFLGIIEQRIAEIVQLHNLSTAGMPDETIKAVISRNKKNQAKPAPQVVVRPNPPGTEEFADSDPDEADDIIKPYSIAELQEKTSAVINRRKDLRKARKQAGTGPT